jgi:hypothetical protein
MTLVRKTAIALLAGGLVFAPVAESHAFFGGVMKAVTRVFSKAPRTVPRYDYLGSSIYSDQTSKLLRGLAEMRRLDKPGTADDLARLLYGGRTGLHGSPSARAEAFSYKYRMLHKPGRPRPLKKNAVPGVSDDLVQSYKVDRAVKSDDVQQMVNDAIAVQGVRDPHLTAAIARSVTTDLSNLMKQVARDQSKYDRLVRLMARDGRTSDDVVTDLQERLIQLAKREAQKPNPAFTFEAASGKLSFHRTYLVAGGEVKIGELNAYKILGVVGASTTCIGFVDCVDDVKDGFAALLGESTDGKGSDDPGTAPKKPEVVTAQAR